MDKFPRVSIVYSPIYDKELHRILNLGKKLKSEFNWNEREKYGKDYAKKLQEKWDSGPYKSLSVMSKVSGLPWRESVVTCYLISNEEYFRSFSDPLTVRIRENMEECIDVLIHEMTHRLLLQNMDKVKNNSVLVKYRNENETTRHHIPVFAILKALYQELYGLDKFQKIKSRYKNKPHYLRAIEIVEKEGIENLLPV